MPKEDFLYYYRISIKEVLDIETEKHGLKMFNDRTISKNFKNEKHVCDVCFKLVTDIDKFGKMHIIWVNNSKYRAYTNLWRNFTDEIMKKEKLVDKYGYIDVSKYNGKTTLV